MFSGPLKKALGSAAHWAYYGLESHDSLGECIWGRGGAIVVL